MFLAEGQDLLGFSKRLTDADNGGDPGVSCPDQDLFAVNCKAVDREVGMGIDKCGCHGWLQV